MVRRSGSVEPAVSPELMATVREMARPLRSNANLGPLLERIGERRFVLIGEASHGNHEFYTCAAEISKRLIVEKGFRFVAVEGDWPDCYRLNRYVKGLDGGDSAYDVLHGFSRWPTWMWANEEIVEFAEWLRLYNDDQPEGHKVGFFGLDVYSLWDSLHEVTGYLRLRVSGSCLLPAERSSASNRMATMWRNTPARPSGCPKVARTKRSSCLPRFAPKFSDDPQASTAAIEMTATS